MRVVVVVVFAVVVVVGVFVVVVVVVLPGGGTRRTLRLDVKTGRLINHCSKTERCSSMPGRIDR